MCGLLGASSNTPLNMDNIKLLYLLNKERGDHSCGFSDGNVLLKEKMTPEEYLLEVMNGKLFPKEVKNFIGHTRLATKGVINKENAHPFDFPDILTGTHNGTIDNFKALQEAFGTDYDVDSEFIYYLLSKYDLEKVTPLLQGALALAYHDYKKDHMTLYRWVRPLYYGVDKDNDKTIWYSSLKYYLEAIDCKNIEELPEHTVMHLKDGEIIHKEKLDDDTTPTRPQTKYRFSSYIPEMDLYDKKEFLAALGDEYVNGWLQKEKYARDERRSTKKIGSGSTKLDNRHFKLSDEIPQYAMVKKYDGKLIHWWFDEIDYNLVYIKEGKNETESFDLASPASNEAMWSSFEEPCGDIYEAWCQLCESIELRIQHELTS